MAQGVFWIGQDGNIWMKDAGGTRNMGNPTGDSQYSVQNNKLVDKYADYEGQPGSIKDYDMIPDPVVKQSAPTGGGGRTYEPLNQAAVDATNQKLTGLDTILARALSDAVTKRDNIRDALNTQQKQGVAQYDENTLRNMQNYDSNLGASLRAGRSGLSGLMAALRGGGGGGNDFARDWVQNTVADTTYNDIREGYDTFDENRRGLDSSHQTFLNDLAGRRRENEETFENNQRAARLYDAQQRQEALQTLSGLYGDAGNRGQADTFMRQAGDQNAAIAQNMGAEVRRFNDAPIQVQSPDMTAFSSPERQAMTATPNRRNTGVFAINDPRRLREEEKERV